jgi:hypothetical protein
MPKRLQFTLGEKIPLSKGGFSDLVYLGEAGKSESGTQRKITVRCPCGVKFDTQLGLVRDGHTQQCKKCGYDMVSKKLELDITGQKFGRLTVVKCNGEHRGNRTYLCICECGNFKDKIPVNRLINGNVRSCGCLRKEVVSTLKGTNWEPGAIIGHFKIIERLPSSVTGQQKYRALNMRTGNTLNILQGSIQRYSTDFNYFKVLIRKRTRNALRRIGINKTRSAIKGMPWTIEEMLEKIGPCPGDEYHLDHVAPMFLAETEDEVLALNNPINLRWIKAVENLSKGAKWSPEGAKLCLELLGREWIDPSIKRGLST